MTPSRKSVRRRSFGGLALLYLVLAVILFGTAGTFDYWQAWLFLAVYAACSLAITLHLMVADPALLQRRMRGGAGAEREPAQKIIMRLMLAGFIGLVVVPGLDHRFGWSDAPWPVALLGRRWSCSAGPSFTSSSARTLSPRPQSSWRRTSGSSPTGSTPISGTRCMPAGLAMLAGIPLSLGSWWGLLVLVATMPVLAWRLLNEEAFLQRNLAGYTEYCASVRSRLIPHVL